MTLRISERDNSTKAAIEVMRFNEQFQDEPRVGIFWYDTKFKRERLQRHKFPK